MKAPNKSELIYLTDYYGLIHITCKECDFEDTILCKYSGFSKEKNNAIIQIGYQCQLCGKYTRRIYYPELTIIDNLTCECGGNLEREKPLFCPKCQCLHLNFYPVVRIH